MKGSITIKNSVIIFSILQNILAKTTVQPQSNKAFKPNIQFSENTYREEQFK